MSISKEEYLKRYMDKDPPKKRKRKNVKAISSRMKILEDNVDILSTDPHKNEVDDVDLLSDDEPTVAEVIDDRPEHMKEKDSRWKPMSKQSTKNKLSLNKNGKINKNVSKLQNVDLSPPRQHRRNSKSSLSDPNESDTSPPRKIRHDSDTSPPRKIRHDSDTSPPRKIRHDSDTSPPRRMRHDSDTSPTRIMRHDSDTSPPRKVNKSSKDISITQKKRQNKDSLEQHPKHTSANQNTKQSKSNRRSRSNSVSDRDRPLPKSRRIPSGARREPFDNGDSGASSPRQGRRSQAGSVTPTPDAEEQGNGFQLELERGKKMKKTLAGTKAGLSTARELKAEMEKKKKADERFMDTLDPRDLGRGAKTTVRKSKRPKELTEEEKLMEEEKEKKEKEMKKKYEEWGKGVKQVANQSKRLEEDLYEMTKPLARYHGDEDLEDNLRDVVHKEEDPMAEYILKKRKKRGNGGDDEEGKPALPRYNGKAGPPNRFNIEPGYRWDGVNRSTGFENKIVQDANRRKAQKSDAYKWSVEDM